MQIGYCPSGLNMIGGYAQTIQCKTASWTLSQASTCRAASRRRDDWARQEIRASCSQPAEMKQARPRFSCCPVARGVSKDGCHRLFMNHFPERSVDKLASSETGNVWLELLKPRGMTQERCRRWPRRLAAGIRSNKGELHENRAFADGNPPRQTFHISTRC